MSISAEEKNRYDQEKTIQEVRKQIEECLPDIMERIQQQDAEPTQEQTM